MQESLLLIYFNIFLEIFSRNFFTKHIVQLLFFRENFFLLKKVVATLKISTKVTKKVIVTRKVRDGNSFFQNAIKACVVSQVIMFAIFRSAQCILHLVNPGNGFVKAPSIILFIFRSSGRHGHQHEASGTLLVTGFPVFSRLYVTV